MELTYTKLGKYELIKEIGRGSMGVVYVGHDPFADQSVAIKVAHAESLQDEEWGSRYRKMFFNEAHTAGLLTHPNIIKVYDAGIDNEICYLVMEYVEHAITLKSFCNPDALLPMETVVEIIFKCAKALDYAHRQGVIHRDIKPTNILLAGDRDVKISDFSIAHITKPDTNATLPMGMVGSPLYMSPEQITEDYITHQSDLFSLGVVMYELLTGKHPFAADNFSRLIHRIVNDTPYPLNEYRRDIPHALEKIVSRVLEKDRGRRYGMGGDLALDLSLAFRHLDRPEEAISAQERFIALKKLEFFCGFPDTEIGEIVRTGIWRYYENNMEILAEGELDDSFHLIVSGHVAVRKGGKDLSTLGQGDCFGEIGHANKVKSNVAILAKDQVSLLKMHSTMLGQLSLNCQARFLKAFLTTLVRRLSHPQPLRPRTG
jgi:serine/threonine protein kinase